MKKLFEKYNSEDSLFVVSLYPKKGEMYSAGTSGVASYGKNVIANMKRGVVVLADYKDKPSIYEEDNTLIVRCFKTNSPFMWGKILGEIRHFAKIKRVLIQFDFAVYGGMLTSSLILPMLCALRLLGKETSVIIHHVVLDINKLSGHVGLGNSMKDKIKAVLYNSAFHLFYMLLGIMTNNIVVLEEPLKKKLATLSPLSNIITIPHGVDTNLMPIDKTEARKQLGFGRNEKIILFFGFVNWFKGADFFADTFRTTKKIMGKKAKFIIAGGASPTLRNKHYYQEYFTSVTQAIDASSSVQMTGYVPQEQIKLYFSAADLVVFPYRHFMTASGVLSLVFSYKKPFIISKNIAEMFDAPDLETALKASHLQKNDLVFDLSKKSCFAKTEKVLKNGLKKKMINLTHLVAQKRSYKNTAALYENALFLAPDIALKKSFAPEYNKYPR